MNKNELNKLNDAKWYIASAVNGNEVSAVKNLLAKVTAIHYEDLILDAKVIMNKLVTNIYFDENDPNNKPPKSMKNSTNITWSVIGSGKYKKQIVHLENKFPGYIFVKMIMTDESWYAVRNSPKITGLIGSSGSGIKPQPIDNEEVENVLNNTKPYNEYVIIGEEQIMSDGQPQPSSENTSTSEQSSKISTIPFKVGNTVVANVGDEKITGIITSIDYKNKKVTLSSTIFGIDNEVTTSLDNIKVDETE